MEYVDNWYSVYSDNKGSTYHAHDCTDGSVHVDVDNRFDMSFTSKRKWNEYVETHKLKCIGADHD